MNLDDLSNWLEERPILMWIVYPLIWIVAILLVIPFFIIALPLILSNIFNAQD